MNPYDFFIASACRQPSRVALKDADGQLTYEAAAREVEGLASRLSAHGITNGMRIAVMAPNCNDAMVAALALFRLGAVWLPVNSRNSVEQNIAYLQACEAHALVWHHEMEAEAFAIGDGLSRAMPLISLRTDARPSDLPMRRPDPTQICAMLSTGGTTGTPKAVVWTERVVQTMIASFWIHLPHHAAPVYLAATPLTHAAGVIAFCMLARGATVLIHRGVQPGDFLDAIQQERVTHLFLPPTAIYSLLAHPDVRSYDYSSLRYFIYSAAPMASEKIREAFTVFGPVMVQLYGQAEVPLMAAILTPEDHALSLDVGMQRRLQSCGRATLLVQIEVLDESGRIVPDGERGEIAIRSDLVMERYYAHAIESAQVGRNGWHHTGDVGYKDSDGYLYIVDRLKDMIITGGFNVFSSEVEQVVLAHPAVQDCAVVGQPDEKWGEAVTAVIQLKPGARLEIEELRATCRERLGAVKAPKHFLVWDDLPRSPVGKVLKRVVREHFWKGRTRRV